MANPRDILLGAQAAPAALPVCDHYCGVESRMRKSLALQMEMAQQRGWCLFDVTLDCEDGAPVGEEREHAQGVAELIRETAPGWGGLRRRVAVRLHPVDHPAFEQDVALIVGTVAPSLCHVMIPKVESTHDLDRAARLVARAAERAGRSTPLPLHALIESPAAVHQVFDLAAHPAVESLSFGLMDFVSAHGGAIPAQAMGLADDPGGLDQFSHPLVLQAKLAIAAACHANAKVPSHCVVTELHDMNRLRSAARQVASRLGYTRMWSIHPTQIQPILEAFEPDSSEVILAGDILLAAQRVDWAPIAAGGKLHDRASYRYFWQVLERAHRLGQPIPAQAKVFFDA
ncbi:MAG: CoA ester lyase [Rhodoferax sp.]|nr:CoA ester lyase [Rhodoferax sp.]